MTNKLSKEKDYVLYQQICDEIFGEGTVKIKPASSNNVIGTFKYIDDYSNFIQNFKKRLIRLRELYEHTTAYPDILEQVKQVADPKNWEGAYAELVAYDVMWNDFINKPIEINKTLPATESYAGEMGFKYKLLNAIYSQSILLMMMTMNIAALEQNYLMNYLIF